MSNRLQCYLTPNDHAVLREILDQTTSDNAYRRLLRRKLAQAEITPRNVPDDVVTINSRVTFCVDAGVPRTANLVRNDGQDFPNYTVSVESLLGLGLLGLGAGRAIAVETEAGGLQKINVIGIDFQALALPGAPMVTTLTLSPRIRWDRSQDVAQG
ncbi:GreA/GreB family elongation factor [Sinorhizobium americanum]|uniref:Regulator of nucleoside diphosphate kinase n=1 Tax=Sinorhizobium americanum TaxID=194963 RepID=A0A4R2AVR8_9HYPH|nr:GreA/GreB family elongation factor [Sinorhizobium americanum]TCN18048.1 regulator of nucleoside diphosphate kinase [Sinorhizobium americanum]